MEELIKLVSERSGISTEQARSAVQTVAGFLKDKLPPALAAQVEPLLEGGASNDVADQSRQAIGGLRGLFDR